MRSRDPRILFFTSVLLILTRCDSSVFYSDTVRMEDQKWSMYDPGRFSCIVDDTTASFNISFSVRTSTDYPYRNLYLFVNTSFPSGTFITDTLQAILADEKGIWLGKGAGDIRGITIPYKSNVYFPEKGEYIFTIIHGMRDTVIPGVYDIGMKISQEKE